jgi:hypothetical protein
MLEQAALGDGVSVLLFTEKNENDTIIKQIRSSAGAAVFVSDSNDRAHWVKTGRCYERFPLQAEALELLERFTASLFDCCLPATCSNELDNLFSLQVQVDPPHIERGFRNLFGLDDKHLPISPFYTYSSFTFRSFQKRGEALPGF